jgi:hypothetical protein
MSLFVCEKCNCVDNTATSRYWNQMMEARDKGKEFKPLCSECDPELGRWHGKFPKQEWDGDVTRVVNRG